MNHQSEKYEEEKKEYLNQIYQHNEKLFRALYLPCQGEDESDYNYKVRIRKGIQQIFAPIKEELQSASLSSPPSAKITKGYQHLLDAYVPKEKQSQCLSIIDKHNKFAYSSGIFRRTVRSLHYWELNLEAIFSGYYDLSFYAETMSDFYKKAEERYELENRFGKYINPSIRCKDDLIAAELDSGTTDLAQVIEEILMSENNTNRVTIDLIRGIVKSDNTHLHKILGDFLLAARLQEGVRQAVCEHMDCGTKEAFLTLFHIITEHNLIRFSAVKRAISTWTGLCDENNLDRITKKQVDLMQKSLYEKEFCETLLQSNDSIELYIGLWTLGFFEIEDAISCCKNLILNGTKNQKLVVSYYNRSLQNERFTMQTASLMLETYPQDMELCAAFLPTYMPNSSWLLRKALYGNSTNIYLSSVKKEYVYEAIPYETFFMDEAQARKHFYLWKDLYYMLPKKGYTYSPCIFPWCSVSITPDQVAYRMAMLAYMLQDNEIIDQICPLLSEIDYNRTDYLLLLLHQPKTDIQRQTLLQALADKQSNVRKYAFDLVSDLDLEENDYKKIASFLKYKSPDIRKHILDLLEKQEETALFSNLNTLLHDKKEEVRLGGLDLLTRLKKDKNHKDFYQTCCTLLTDIKQATEKEEILIAELTGASQADSVLNKKGYGLYNPDTEWLLPDLKEENPSLLLGLFHKTKQELYSLLEQLEVFYTQNKNLEYKKRSGEEVLLDHSFSRLYYESEKDILDCYPFPELWKNFYQEKIKDFPTLLSLYIFTRTNCISPYYRTKMSYFASLAKDIYGEDYFNADFDQYPHQNFLCHIIEILYLSYSKQKENKALLTQAAYSIITLLINLPIEKSIYIVEDKSSISNEKPNQITNYALDTYWFSNFLSCARDWETDQEFDQMFLHFETANQFYGSNILKLNFLDYVKAYERNLISLDNLYQAAFDGRHYIGLFNTFSSLRFIVCYPDYGISQINHYLKKEEPFENNAVAKIALDLYWNITEMILKVELKRSETNTPFSYMIKQISKIRGIAYLIEILTALGKDTLSRSTYYSYYRSSENKNDVLSRLLSVSEPLPYENGSALKEHLKGKKISDKRLIEVAMYNPKWIDCIEEYLGWKGLKSGIYYFTAHMNERFSDRTKAIIAKYTPLSIEELNQGAFDLNWFLECSKQLGEERFKLLYDSAKYISDSNKHTRARKYADATLGKFTVDELETIITEKRNKDFLMAYPLIPIKNIKDTLRRYQFLQKFLKESKQFGSQRKASEATAVSMGLQNLAMNTGYADVTRLTLNMEAKLAENLKSYFKWLPIDEIRLKIQIDENGKAAVICEKNGKCLKSIPTKYKKMEQVIKIKEVCKQLKEQYSRTKAMMEQFMEDGVTFTVSEMANLQKNPIIQPMLRNLVYLCGEQTGFLNGSILTDYTGTETKLAPKKTLRIAHPFDLWQLGIWQKYQKILFERTIKQPFKQVFRELYVKTEEEAERVNSLRYAGNQIQPQKTVACLKGRHWIADYESGLQKIYYKENIVARIYALADWFSPSDIEAPTLEWVEFSDRKTFCPIKIKDVPDRIFSEVMRDVDLAVSIAHAGGVDPETSHSTMEMRKTILEFNLPLFGLHNVTFTGNHALIKGTRGDYTIHLGSGVIFKQGGLQIAVLPVHSQQRGKLFLPFLDEDPKTAEIMSKIVLFAEDEKIKDPYILRQL